MAAFVLASASTAFGVRLQARRPVTVRVQAPVRRSSRRPLACRASAYEEGITTEDVIGGEWAPNWSLASYEDVMAYFNNKMLKDSVSQDPAMRLADIMQTELILANPDTPLAHIKSAFNNVRGLPVVNDAGQLVGVISRKDLQKSGDYVKDVMSTPPIAAKPSHKVTHAACLMLKYKVHRIPVVDDNKRCVGVVTRSDIFTALEMDSGVGKNIDM